MELQYAIVAQPAPRGSPIRVCTLFFVLAVARVAIAQVPDAPAPAISVEDEVLGNIRAQPVGPATVADLALPDEFLRRIADRIVRSSYEERFRIVVSDSHASVQPPISGTDGLPSEPVKTPVAASQVLLWLCLAGFVAVFGTLVWKSRRGAGT